MCNIILHYSFVLSYFTLNFCPSYCECSTAFIDNRSSKNIVWVRVGEKRQTLQQHSHPPTIAPCFTTHLCLYLTGTTNLVLRLWMLVAYCLWSTFFCLWTSVLVIRILGEPNQNVLFYRYTADLKFKFWIPCIIG